MHPNRLNAAQLLMNYSAQENGRICQKIQHKEFSHELRSAAASPQETENVSSAASAIPCLTLPVADSHGQERMGPDRLLPSPPEAGLLQQIAPSGGESRKPTLSDCSIDRKGITALKPVRTVKALATDDPAFTNPLLLDKILAQLQFPAEVRRHCVDRLEKGGALVVAEFHRVLAEQPVPTSQRTAEPPLVSISDVQELINSIRLDNSASVRSVKAIKLKKDGGYTLDELKELLRPLAQHKKFEALSRATRRTTDPPVDPLKGEGDLGPAAPVSAAPEGYVEKLSTIRLPAFTEPSSSRVSRTNRLSPVGEQDRDFRQVASDFTMGAPGNVRAQSSLELGTAYDNPSDETEEGMAAILSAPERSPRPMLGSSQGENPFDKDSAVRAFTQRQPAQGDDTARVSDPVAPGRQSRHAASTQDPSPASVTVSSVTTDFFGEDTPASVEEVGDGVGDFEAPSVSGADPFEGHAEQTSGRSSQGRQERDQDPGGSHAPTAAEKTAGSGRARDETFIGMVSAAGGAEIRPQTEVRAERVNLQHPRWPEKLADHVVDGVRSRKSSLVVELEPQELGHITLRIEADHRQVSAWISTRNEEVRGLLLQNSSSLQKHLAEQGLSLAQLAVNVGDGRDGTWGSGTRRHDRRASRIPPGPGMEPIPAGGVPGVHQRLLGQGGNQTISLVV